ncbi:hypothetical protein [Georhizobium profundi]|uniref:hypothetical protein n=1 Tax=Georhizobium profundi TaxID=2341112 RepID=UPI000F7F988D|nr:hypothetical protein [Georhizobium profundi]
MPAPTGSPRALEAWAGLQADFYSVAYRPGRNNAAQDMNVVGQSRHCPELDDKQIKYQIPEAEWSDPRPHADRSTKWTLLGFFPATAGRGLAI